MLANFSNFILFISFYSFLGWLIECFYKSLFEKKWVNSGFLSGPFCPIYGFGALFMIRTTESLGNWIYSSSLLFVSRLVIATLMATVFEYFVASLLEKCFDSKWWDYSEERMNYKGRICVKYSIGWSILAYILLYCIHPGFKPALASLSLDTKYLLMFILMIYFILDSARTIHQLMTHKHSIIVDPTLYTMPKLSMPNIGKLNHNINDYLNSKIDKIKLWLKN